jgi:hypothetical protein
MDSGIEANPLITRDKCQTWKVYPTVVMSAPLTTMCRSRALASAQASTIASCKYTESTIAYSITVQTVMDSGIEANPLITRDKCQTRKVNPSVLDRTHNHLRLAADPHLRTYIGQMLTKGAE